MILIVNNDTTYLEQEWKFELDSDLDIGDNHLNWSSSSKFQQVNMSIYCTPYNRSSHTVHKVHVYHDDDA